MPPELDEAPAPHSSRLRFELILASLLLAFGLFVMPAVIFWVGISLLGPYGPGTTSGTLGTFYGDFFGDLASGSVRTWCLALGPLFLISVARVLFMRKPDEPVDPPPETAPRRAAKTPIDRRVEPRITLD